MKKLVLIAIVALALSTAAYALICTDSKTCPTPCGIQSAPMCPADANSCKPAPKCGAADPNHAKCGSK